MQKTLVIGDMQITAENLADNERLLKSLGELIIKQRPEEIVIIGDFWDFESLSYYASNLAKEGQRLKADIDAGEEALSLIFDPLMALQFQQKKNKKRVYRPRLAFCMGNHEERYLRLLEKEPILIGLLPKLEYILGDFGIEYYDFLEPYVGINYVHYFHYLANPMTGKAIGGSMDNKLNKVTYSFVMGHQQHFQFAERQQATGNPQFGVVVGAMYDHDEAYKGFQGNTHSRGTVMLHHHEGGSDVEFLSTARIKEKYA